MTVAQHLHVAQHSFLLHWNVIQRSIQVIFLDAGLGFHVMAGQGEGSVVRGLYIALPERSDIVPGRPHIERGSFLSLRDLTFTNGLLSANKSSGYCTVLDIGID